MTKSSGLGQGLLIAGYDLSNDFGAIGSVGGGPAVLDVTGLDKSAIERIGGLLDGQITGTAFLNDATGRAHPVLRALPTTDRHVAYFMASTIGAEAACIVAKQIDYSATRAADGALTFEVPHVANGYSLEWCNLLTAGKRTDTTATNGASLDGAAATTTGWAAYLQVIALTGTNVVVTLEDSANDSDFAAVTAGAFTSAIANNTTQRITGAAGATLRRYVRAVTTGTFTSATFLVAVTRRPTGS